MSAVPKILATAVSVPPFALDQADVAKRVQIQFSKSSTVARLMPVFANTGIERRYSCVPIDWYYDAHDWTDRNRIYLESALNLLEAATRQALERAGLRVEDVGAIVVVSTTGIATPSLDALLMERMGMRRTVRRLPIFGLGCAGGAIGLARAGMVAQTNPGEHVLFLVVELCALSFRRDETTKSNIVATALFGDGAAAAIVSAQGDGPAIVDSGEYTWPDSLDIMGWDVANDGLQAIFSRDIPALVETKLRDAALTFLARRNLGLGDVDEFVCHPGGTKVLDALEDAYDVERGSMVHSRAVMREYGNMSAATILFVLDRLLNDASRSWNRALLSALGPGFTAGFALLERS